MRLSLTLALTGMRTIINVDENGKLCGDVDFADLEGTASAATPVPGGVGGVTTAVLAQHLVRAARMKQEKNSNK